MPTQPQTSSPRSGVLPLALPDLGALHAAYVSAFAEGGIFIATPQTFRLGDEVQVLLTLPGDVQSHAITGKVGWVTPAGAGGHRTQGIGVCFPKGAQSTELKARIEQMLGAALASERPTQTL